MEVCVLGRIGYDLHAVEQNQPLADVKHFSRHLGGSSANIAVGLARLGLSVGIISSVGKDALADFLVHQPFEKSTVPIDPRLYLIFGSKDFPAELDKDEIGVSVRGIVFTGNALPTSVFETLLLFCKILMEMGSRI